MHTENGYRSEWIPIVRHHIDLAILNYESPTMQLIGVFGLVASLSLYRKEKRSSLIAGKTMPAKSFHNDFKRIHCAWC